MRLKKIIMLSLVAVLMISAMTTIVIADNSESFKVGVEVMTATPFSFDQPVVDQGEEITVRINIQNNPGVSFLKFVTAYDANAWEYVEASLKGNALLGSRETISQKEGAVTYTLILSGTEVSYETGTLLEFRLRAKETFCGKTEFALRLYQDREANCKKYTSASKSETVPFEGGACSTLIHNLDWEAGNSVEASCTDNGYTSFICSDCGEEIRGNVLPALGHTPLDAVVENRVEATCTENGSYDLVVYCDRCGEELSRETVVIPALGHAPLDAVVENRVEATCTENGSYDLVVYCDRCGEELSRETVVIPAFGHTESTMVEENRIDPDCLNAGSYEAVIYCAVCGEELSRKTVVIPALGDFGNTGEVTEDDAIYLLLYTLFPEDYPIDREVDLDGDGEVTSEDAIYLLAEILFPGIHSFESETIFVPVSATLPEDGSKGGKK